MIARRSWLLAATGLVASSSARPQWAGKTARIGVLGLNPQDEWNRVWGALVDELARRDFVVGRNLEFVMQTGGTETPQFERKAVELVERKVDLILVANPGDDRVARAAMKATTTIPIVVFISGDPVFARLAASLARPGGNVTGNSSLYDKLIVKRLELIADAVGQPARIGFIGTHYPGFTVARAAAERRAQLHLALLKSADELDEAFEGMAHQRVQALVIGGTTFALDVQRTAALALRHRLPAISHGRGWVSAGLLMHYGLDHLDLARKTADKIDRILKGANPGNLPFERPTKIELFVNLKTATALGMTMPKSILLRADEVIR